MPPRDFEIDKDIRRASTLPARVYSDPEYFEFQKDRVFARSWQWIGDSARVKAPGRVSPLTLLDGCLNEPLVLTVESGHRESSESWAYVLRDLKARGLVSPRLTIADGHLGIWGALGAVYPTSLEQRCWNHKLRNVLDVVALKHQPAVRARLQQIAAAESKVHAERMRREFRKSYECVHPKAVERLERDWERMISYYAFPKEHWKHIRTTNIIESPFSAVRLRTGAAKRFKRVENATALIWKMLLVVEQRFRKLNAPHLLAEIYAGIEYKDGVRAVSKSREQRAA